MGNYFSSPRPSTKAVHMKTRRNSSISGRIGKMILTRKEVMDADPHPITFEKIILKLERLHSVLKYVKQLFYSHADSSGHLYMKDLPKIMQTISSTMTVDEIYDLFDYIDVTHSKSIGLKEFLVSLCVGYVLDIIPAFHDALSVNQLQLEFDSSSFSEKLFHRNKDIKEVLELLVSTFILFDPQGGGCINRKVVDKIIKEKQKKENLDLMFSAERWDEMGWDNNGNIDFAEFVFHFSSWVDLFED